MSAHRFIRRISGALFALLVVASAAVAQTVDNFIGPGDILKVSVFQNPDLTLETRVSETGFITFPLVGKVNVGGLDVPAAEQRLSKLLRDGGFVKQPQVNILVLQLKSNTVSVLGQVLRPGVYPLEKPYRVTDALALAGGVTTFGSDVAIVTSYKDGKPTTKTIDVAQMFLAGDMSKDILIAPGDVIYVHRAPQFYIYGEVQRPGGYRLERDMTIMQALSLGGGLTIRGTERGIRVNRRMPDGRVEVVEPKMTDLVQPDDTLFVRESIF